MVTSFDGCVVLRAYRVVSDDAVQRTRSVLRAIKSLQYCHWTNRNGSKINIELGIYVIDAYLVTE